MKTIEEFWFDFEGNRHRVLSPRKLNYEQPGPKKLRDFVYKRDGHRCKICSNTDSLVIDHIVSIKNSGTNHPDNLRCLCETCNARKTGLFDARNVFNSIHLDGDDWVASIDSNNQVRFGMIMTDRSISISLPVNKAKEMAKAILSLTDGYKS